MTSKDMFCYFCDLPFYREDEVCPGCKIKFNNNRKSSVISYNY